MYIQNKIILVINFSEIVWLAKLTMPETIYNVLKGYILLSQPTKINFKSTVKGHGFLFCRSV